MTATALVRVHRAVLGRKEWGAGGEGGALLGWVAGSILVLRNLWDPLFAFSQSQNADTISLISEVLLSIVFLKYQNLPLKSISSLHVVHLYCYLLCKVVNFPLLASS